MIGGIFHEGSGLGNQLHRYVMVRVLAADKGYEWGMTCTRDGSGKGVGFKGASFMPIDMGQEMLEGNFDELYKERVVKENGADIRPYDPEINFVKDKTVIDGEFQDERYFNHRLSDIREWLRVEPLDMPDDLCVIGFRGGEYSLYPELFLPKEYWEQGIAMMREINPSMRFEVHTDDVPLAQSFFPEFKVTHDIGLNWRSIRYAKWLLIANSSFFIFPALLGNAEKIIAPRYWARHNTGVWTLPQNYYKRFTYI